MSQESIQISLMEGEEDQDGLTTLTVENGSQLVLNEETGEVEIIDLGDPSISQQVEVVTVESSGSNAGLYKALASSHSHARKLPIGSPHPTVSSMIHSGSHRIKNAPALLRNSRRFQPPVESPIEVTSSSCALFDGSTTRHSATSSASQLPSASASYLNRSIGGKQSTGSLGIESDQISLQPGYQQAVVLDENGQPTDEFVILAPNESGEFQVIERGTRDSIHQQEYFNAPSTSTTEMDKSEEMNSFQHQGQTIIICQDSENNQESQFMEDEDGNLIPVDSQGLTYQFNDSTIFSLDEVEITPIGVSPPSKNSKSKKKIKKPLQVIIGPDGKPLKKKGQTELKCMEKGCPTVCYNVFELRKHLTVTHAIHFDVENINFKDQSEFKQWRENYEKERMVSFIYRGGTKKIAKDQAVTYMICHRSGHYKPTMLNESLRKRKMKPQGSCKMGGYCTAGIKLLKNLDNSTIKMNICHTHYGHPLDSDAIPHLRVNPTLRKVILGKFQEGLSFTEVLAYIHHNPDRLEGLRLVDRRAVRNIFDAWKNPSKRSKKAQQDIDEITTPYSTVNISDVEFEDADDPLTTKIETETGSKLNESNEDVKASKSIKNHLELELPIAVDETEENQNTLLNHPKLVEVNMRKKSLRKKKSQLTKDLEEMNTSVEDVEEELDISVIKVEVDDSPSKGRYRLRPNRKVEVYKKAKPNNNKSNVSSVKDKGNDKIVATSSKKSPSTDEKSFETAKKIVKVKVEPVHSIEPVSLSAGLETAIEKLNNHGESGPTVLFYKKSDSNNISIGNAKKELRKEDFCVVLQTPVQRQLLQMFPTVIGFETLESPKSDGHLKLGFIMVLDEYREAIPVAWIVSNSVVPRILKNFFRVIKDECGDLQSEFLMASPNSEAHRLWCSTFSKDPKLIFNDTDLKRDLKSLISQHFNNDKTRRDLWDVLELIINEPQVKEFDKLRKKNGPLYEKLRALIEICPAFTKKFQKDWLSNAEEWALCYRLRTPVNVIGISNSFGKLKKFVSFKGTKNLHESFEHILKIGYDKCFLRSKRMFKGDQKFSQFMDGIKLRHALSRSMENSIVKKTDIEEKHIVKLTENIEYEVTYVESPCDCRLVCKQCKVCAHMYLCTCSDYISTQIMCEHIHLVHCNRNNIEDEPEFVTGDINDSNETSEDGVFGKFKTLASGENPGQLINIDAVLKAAGFFHRADGLQPDQIVSITDADTHAVIYEHKPEPEPMDI